MNVAKKPKSKPGQKRSRPLTVTAEPTRCPVCESTRRGRYTKITWQDYGGIAPDGHPFTTIARRWTKCVECGQSRIDREYVDR